MLQQNTRIMRCILLFVFFINAAIFGQIPITIDNTRGLPASVDNSANDYFRPIIPQTGETCGNVSGLGYVFTYEMNSSRAISSKTGIADNCFPYCYTYQFLNGGYDTDAPDLSFFYHMFTDAWVIARENGIMTIKDFGANNDGYSTTGFPTRWQNGYDAYYRGMQYRVDKIDSVDMKTEGAMTKMKQWLFDHGNQSKVGGIFNVTFNVYGVQTAKIASGPESGKTILKRAGTDLASTHGFSLVGYNDSIRYDFNGDGAFTNNKDINSDGVVDQSDWEIGAVKIAHTWGTSTWDGGFAYLSYRYLVMSPENGGIGTSNRLYFITVKKDYKPQYTFKISMTHSQRNSIALGVGVSSSQSSDKPEKTRYLQKLFSYSGGANPMGGKNQSATLEFGLDITDLKDSVANIKLSKLFLIVDSKSDGGTVNSLSAIDYTNTSPIEAKSSQSNVAIKSGKTYIAISFPTPIVKNDVGLQSNYIFNYRKYKNRVQLQSYFNAKHSLIITDLRGKQLGSIPIDQQSLSWTELPFVDRSGIYIIQLKDNNSRTLFTRRIAL